ncbi:molybdenum cofactor biosynthesis protein [Capsulimonas corticalis]|uniref:Molybdenum cofactor biosynthesis protein n=1 Tax=Capsulimonas corticalis TaxID=2219043 RepID=A0A402CVH9_9BACT|nr:MOSC N-terminal beta barrel domain-containing protein [Capsulimonas corticalis]BDI30409.1 molybdenum cofactor biosynthesis protein [Capsulimonas corticalis]
MPYLARILLYPIKSLDPMEVTEATILPTGALRHDREFGIFDAEEKFVNGKRSPRVHGLTAAFHPTTGELRIAIRSTGESRCFQWPDDCAAMDAWLSDYFDQPVSLRRDAGGGFPDDKNALGPTVISTATLEEVASWFPGLSVESARVRFRANLEIGGVPPFWEDQLFGDPETIVPFQIGDVLFHGINPCQRCVVPPRDPQTGEAIPEFSQTFRERREATLPAWANRARFNHFYRLAINTRAPESETGKTIRIDDSIRL